MNQSLIDQTAISGAVAGTWLEPLVVDLFRHSTELLEKRPHGDRKKWLDAICGLPEINVSAVNFDREAVSCESTNALSRVKIERVRNNLMQLHPWRKGPFDLFGIRVDSEWQSNKKWGRIENKIASLRDKTVLDVGCGNGYYLFRMLGAGAKAVVGIDPTQLFIAQFAALQNYFGAKKAIVLPMKGEEFLSDSKFDRLEGFDSIFSMGVYYHRKNPLSHLEELYRLLNENGELVLETLVIAGGQNSELDIPDRYAQMRNVWSVPTVNKLYEQLEVAGFCNCQKIDLTPTTVEEQRSTSWMQFDSLDKFLDPNDHKKTIEGLPAPLRVTVTARKK